MVGDADQLPSVGAGNVLRDILDSEVIPSVRLTEIFRQDEKSMIVYNAHRINRGESPRLNAKGSDFFFERASSPTDAAKRIVALCSTRLPGFLGLDVYKRQLSRLARESAVRVLISVCAFPVILTSSGMPAVSCSRFIVIPPFVVFPYLYGISNVTRTCVPVGA